MKNTYSTYLPHVPRSDIAMNTQFVRIVHIINILNNVKIICQGKYFVMKWYIHTYNRQSEHLMVPIVVFLEAPGSRTYEKSPLFIPISKKANTTLLCLKAKCNVAVTAINHSVLSD